MSGHSEKKVVIAAFIGNFAIAVMKLIAAFATGSAAMMAEAFHSIADTLNQVMLLVGLARSRRPPDEEHPFGHGKEIYFWAFVVAVSIFFLGAAFSIYEGVHKILHPEPVTSLVFPLVVLGAAMVFESWSFSVAYKEAKKITRGDGILGFVDTAVRTKDPTVLVVLFEDTAALLGLVTAAVGISLAYVTGIAIIDGATSIVIGLILLAVALFLARETKALLIGESASREDRRKMAEAVATIPDVELSGPLMTMHLGPDYILVNLDIEFSDRLTTDGVEAVVDEIERRIKEAVPAVKKIYIEAEALRKTPGGEEPPPPKGPA